MSNPDGSTSTPGDSCRPFDPSRLLLLPSLGLHYLFVPESPRAGGCAVCGKTRGTEARCEKCGAWLHWTCYIGAVADARDLDGIHADDEENPANWRMLLCPGCRS